jgi:hypothetical protein
MDTTFDNSKEKTKHAEQTTNNKRRTKNAKPRTPNAKPLLTKYTPFPTEYSLFNTLYGLLFWVIVVLYLHLAVVNEKYTHIAGFKAFRIVATVFPDNLKASNRSLEVV